MKYIAALDYDHLDNGVFLTSVGQALARQQGVRSILIHGESAYTERLIQTGIMREEASVRCIKDLNHRLVALFADQGVATIGLNGYQRELVTRTDGELHLKTQYLNQLPPEPVLLISSLALDSETQKPVPVPLPRFIEFMAENLTPDQVFVFSQSDPQAPSSRESDANETVPEDLKNLSISAQIITASAFGNLPNLKDSIFPD